MNIPIGFASSGYLLQNRPALNSSLFRVMILDRSIRRINMKALKTMLAGIVFAFGLAGLVFAAATATQTVTMTISAISVLGVSGNPAALTVTAPALGGDTPTNPTSNTTYARYTSTVATGVTRRLQANWGVADAAPAGCSLLLTATPAALPNQGTTAGQITMTSTATNIVTGIGSCATGTGPASGAQLAYVMSIDSMTSLVAGESHTVTITLTLTDN
jgi:hypothetical protein